MKYVVVTGGVVSGLGKGVTASSIGAVLQGCGLRVTSIKIDPYINTDAGTMSPYEHGEVYVLNDGGEVDLDLGNYERFLNITLTKDNNITTGKIFQSVIDRERHGDYLGKTVQVVPHVTDAVQDWIERVANIPVDGKEGPADVCVIELGGTVGDIESMHFVEALCQFQFRVGPDNFCLVHVSLIPVIGVVGEQKTKPTQHSVRQLRAAGLVPHLLACRSAHPLEQSTKDKLAQFCHVAPSHILNIHDVSNIWRIPLLLKDQDAHLAILNQLKLTAVPNPRLVEWRDRAECYDKLSHPVNIALVGKYAGFSDAYLSVMKAALHASIACSRKLNMKLVLASDLEKQTQETAPDVHAAAWETLKTVDGILVPGGFGSRGVEGKILAAKYAREAGIPFLGICLGMQVAVIEYCQSVLGLENSNSTEFDEATPHPCVISMLEHSTSRMGGTMRLGARRTYIQIPDSLTSRLYAEQLCFDEVKQQKYLDERHRHRYEVNPDLVERLEKAGLQFVGKDATGQRMEIIELPDHPFYVGVQFHPEFTSRPGHPSAPFLGLMLAASGQLDSYLHAARKTALPAEIAVHAGKKEPHQNGHVKEIYQNGHARELHQHGHAKEKYLSWFAKEAHQNGHIKNNGHAKEIGFAKENGHAQEIYRNELSRGRDDEPCSRSNVDELFAKQEVCNPLSSGHPQRIEEANEAPDDTHAEDRREVCHCSNGPSANDSAFCQLTPSFQNGHFKDTQSNGHGREHGGGCESGENGRRKDALQNGHRKEAVQRLSNGFQNGHGKNHVQNGPGSSSSEDEAEIYESEPGQELTHSVPVAAVHQGHHQNGQIRNGHHSRHALKHGGSKELSSQSKEAVQNELVLELFQNVWEEVVQNGRAMELQNGHGPAVGEQVKEMQNSLGKEAVPNGHGKESAPNGHLSLHMNGNSLTQNGHLNHRLNGSGLGINLVTDGVLV